MIRVVLRDGSYRDVSGAQDAERRGHEILLADPGGKVVARFDCEALIAYGPPETLPGRFLPSKASTYIGPEAACTHAWSRLKGLEEVLDVVVFVRECSKCGRVEAKSGHRDPLSDEWWIPIAEQDAPRRMTTSDRSRT